MGRSVRSVLAVVAAFLALPAFAAAQEGVTVSGRVTSDAGAPLASASVLVDGMGVGTITRDDGRYSFIVPAARATGQQVQLTAKLIGYKAKSVTITLAGSINQDFVLESNPLQLGVVIVTGAGTTSTVEKLGNVINSVDSSAIQRSNESQNIVSALAGQAPNVVVNTQGGDPGSSAFILIRGAKSLQGTNQPLFVVDGSPIDNTTESTNGGDGSTSTQNRAADINPNDVESVQILKGAAAGAIYGARAANGVVLITTKSGHPGATRYSLHSTTSFDKISKDYPLQTTYGQGSYGFVAHCYPSTNINAIANDSLPDCQPLAPNLPASFPAGQRKYAAASRSWGPALPEGTPTFDHGTDIFDTGMTFDNTLQMSGGSDRTTFFLSGGSTNQSGVIVGPNNRYDRETVRLKATHRLFSSLNLNGNLAYTDGRGSYVQKGSNTSGLLLGSLRTPPEFDNRQYLGVSGFQQAYRFRNPSPASFNVGRNYDNPFFTANSDGNKSELGRFISQLGGDWTPVDWLKVTETLNADYYNDWRLEALPLTASGDFGIGLVTREDINNLQIDHNLTATASHTFSPNFAGTFTLGQNLNSRRRRDTFLQGEGLKTATPFSIQNTGSYSPSEAKSLEHTESYFGQATADLFDQVYLTAAARNDGYSTFGVSDRRAWFPKASVAWQFTNALGNKDQKGFLSYGKVRASYGETGKEPIVYQTITALCLTCQFGSGFGDFANLSQSGVAGLVTNASAGNSNLKPERQKEFETGVDLGFLDQKVDVGVTYYSSKATDVILQLPTNGAGTGFSAQLANGAVITNKGWEATLNARPVTGANFSWDFGLQYARNDNHVNSLQGAKFINYNNEGFTGSIGSAVAGDAVGVVQGQDFVRCGRGLNFDPGTGTAVNFDAACGNAPNGALYLDSAGLPVVDPTLRVIANANPQWSGSVHTSLRFYKKWQIGGLLDIRHGGTVWNGTRGALYAFGTHKDTEIRNTTGTFGENFLTDVYPVVAGPGVGVVAFSTPDDWQNWFTGPGGSGGTAQAQFVEDASFVKLREISVAYTADQKWVSSIGFSSIDFRVAGRNLHTWTKYKGLDPESNLGGAEFLTQGIDYFNSPQTRSFVISVGLNK
jgi:TonB-linked SusC/RagA family outer membrane protein